MPRPQFVARIQAFTEQRRREVAEAAAAPSLSTDVLMVLEDHLAISLRRRINAIPLVRLQLRMLQDLVVTEKNISFYKKERSDRQRKLDAGNPEQVRLQREIQALDREIFFVEAEARGIRDIGDGIAWRLFDYDRAIVYELANRPAGKHINPEGLEAELHELQTAVNSGDSIAVLNDLTHFLKLADVTVRKDAGLFELIEAKRSATKSSRITRQRQNLRSTVDFLTTGERETTDHRVQIAELNVDPEAFSGNLGRLLSSASKRGSAVETIGDHLIIECTDFHPVGEFDRDKAIATLERGRAEADEWRERGDFVIPCWSQDRYAHTQNYAPFSIFPLPADSRVKLATGAVFLVAHLNISAVLRYLERMGWRVVKGPDEYLAELEEKTTGVLDTPLVTLRKGNLTTSVPPAILGRLGYEFLRPRAILDMLEATLKVGPNDFNRSFPNLTGEARLWD